MQATRQIFALGLLIAVLGASMAAQNSSGSAPETWGGTGAPLATPATAATALPLEGKISAGDLVEVKVFDTPELSGRMRVSEDGNISLPLIGATKVAGQTPHEAEATIEKSLVVNGFMKNPQVSVFVAQYATQDVSVFGEVTRPGVYPFTAHHRLLDVISAAGGLSAMAGRNVAIYRRDQSVPVETVTLNGNASQLSGTNPELLPGDTVVVSKTGLVYVVGEVTRPGGFPIDGQEKLTAVQAIALAWGNTRNAAMKSTKLIRKGQNGERQEIALDLKGILEGNRSDLTLQDQDIIYVPTNRGKVVVNRGIEAILQTAVGVAIYSNR